jgi:hypothetical protein
VTNLTLRPEAVGHTLYMDNFFLLPRSIWWLGPKENLLLWDCYIT